MDKRGGERREGEGRRREGRRGEGRRGEGRERTGRKDRGRDCCQTPFSEAVEVFHSCLICVCTNSVYVKVLNQSNEL